MTTQLLRFSDVIRKTRLCRSSLYNRLDKNHSSYDASIPRPSTLGARVQVWMEQDIDNWIESAIHPSRS